MTETALTPPATRSAGATRCPDCTDGLGQPRPLKPGSVRERVHGTRGLLLPWRIGVFTLGLVFVMLGVAMTALPGPLTIPPVLLGLWVWSTEFFWAARVFATFAAKGREAWQHARQHPVSSAAVTAGGLVAAGFAFWAVGHYELVQHTRDALGI